MPIPARSAARRRAGPDRRRLTGAVLLALLAAAPGPAAAADAGTFDVSFAGIRAGTLAYEGSESGGTYETRGSARATGLAGAVFDMRVDAAANGRVDGNAYRPRHYSEVTREAGEPTVERRFTYSGAGVPAVTRTPPRDKPRKHAAPAAAQGGTVDPMTAAFAILRDRDDATACALDISIYDGAVRSRIALNRPTREPDRLRCDGTYTRVAGFSPEDMSGQTVWPLTLSYVRAPDGAWRVDRLEFPTSFGRARIVRR